MEKKYKTSIEGINRGRLYPGKNISAQGELLDLNSRLGGRRCEIPKSSPNGDFGRIICNFILLI